MGMTILETITLASLAILIIGEVWLTVKERRSP